MKNLIHTAVVTLFAASAAHAQQAVQWKVSDGGNGHWYGNASVAISDASFWQTQSAASAMGGHLPTISSAAENAFVRKAIGGALGLFHSPGGQWTNVTGEPVTYFAWQSGQPSSLDQFVFAAYCCHPADLWADYSDAELGNPNDPFTGFSVEWDADCNSDGIVDYGQCRDGLLPDYNSNNIPDCCERGEACVVGNYPVQWRIEDGGNGHWYQAQIFDDATWNQAVIACETAGGGLVCITTSAEWSMVTSLYRATGVSDLTHMWTGGQKAEGNAQWEWRSGEAWGFTAWGGAECPSGPYPNNPQSESLALGISEACGVVWDDYNPLSTKSSDFSGWVIEWSADCNNDGIVDYGQILQGQLGDTNTDGIPDICQQPTCRDADLFRDFNVNGADLGILLSQWGPNTALTVSDINKDGFVNGADLGIMLAFWGPCPN
jgi:hypothetical protein